MCEILLEVHSYAHTEPVALSEGAKGAEMQQIEETTPRFNHIVLSEVVTCATSSLKFSKIAENRKSLSHLNLAADPLSAHLNTLKYVACAARLSERKNSAIQGTISS